MIKTLTDLLKEVGCGKTNLTPEDLVLAIIKLGLMRHTQNIHLGSGTVYDVQYSNLIFCHTGRGLKLEDIFLLEWEEAKKLREGFEKLFPFYENDYDKYKRAVSVTIVTFEERNYLIHVANNREYRDWTISYSPLLQVDINNGIVKKNDLHRSHENKIIYQSSLE